MDDEAKQLLREIRDIGLRAEAATKRFRRAWAIVLIVAACTIGFVIMRMDRLMTEVEQAPALAAAPK